MAIDPTQVEDFSSLYTSDEALGASDPTQDLFKSMTEAAKAAAEGTATAGASTSAAPSSVSGGTATTPAPATPGASPSTGGKPQASRADESLLTRLTLAKVPGINTLADLHGKTDVELHKIASDVVTYEQRATTLGKYFFKDPSGAWDFTKDPSGNPTGLDIAGKPVAPPAPPPPPPPPPAAKPTAAKPAAKAPARKPAAKASTPKKVVAKPAVKKPAAKPAPKPVAKKITAAPPSRAR